MYIEKILSFLGDKRGKKSHIENPPPQPLVPFSKKKFISQAYHTTYENMK